MLWKVALLLSFLCPQIVGTSNCFSAKDREALDKKRDPVERYVLLAKIGERQASRLPEHPNSGTWGERPPFRKQVPLHERWDLLDCAWLALRSDLASWKPQFPRDRHAIQEMLRPARHAEKLLSQFQQQFASSHGPSRLQEIPPGYGSWMRTSLRIIREAEEKLQLMSK